MACQTSPAPVHSTTTGRQRLGELFGSSFRSILRQARNVAGALRVYAALRLYLKQVQDKEADETLEQDAQLVQQCLQGDASAWEELVRRHSRRIFNVCYRFTGNRTEAEDLSQDVFLRVYRTLGSYRSAHGGFGTWVTSVTRNLLIDHYRRTKRDRITDSLDDAMPVVENKESAGRRPDEQALLGELSNQVQSALTRLSPELREAVILRDLQQLEYAEIRTVLGVPEGTVKSRINRGRIELARILQQMGVRPS